MEIRKIRPEEKVTESLVATIAYVFKEPEDYKEKLKNPLEHSAGYEKVWAGFDDGGKMCAITTVNDFQMRFDGHTVGMGGVGAVATLPEARKGGYIRGIFEKILPAMRDEEKVFSFLYPFSFSFYRKFGYELCYMPSRVGLPVSFFREYPFPSGMEQYFPGGDVLELLTVYEAFTRDQNLSLIRDEKMMRVRADKDPYISTLYVYLHRDKNKKPDAYLIYNAMGDAEGRTVNIRELVWTSVDGLHAVFGFIGGLEAEYTAVRWDLPPNMNLPALFAEGFDIKIECPPSGMNRIINVQRALELMKTPDRPGRAVIGVADTSLPSNSGRYAVEWEDGAVRSVRQTTGDADIETDIQTLTQLVTGFLTPDEARLKRRVDISGNEGFLRALFPRKDLYIANYF